MSKALKNTLELFNLTRIDRDLYSWTGQSVGFQRIFGGQIMAQCLIAGYQTVVQKPSFQFKKLTKLASASYRSRIVMPSHAAHYLRKERTAGSLSIDKIGDEKNE